MKTRDTHPMGVKVSMPLAAVQGRLLDFATSWTFLAVMSTARAGEPEHGRKNSETDLNTNYNRQRDLERLLGKCRYQGLRSRGQVRLGVACVNRDGNRRKNGPSW